MHNVDVRAPERNTECFVPVDDPDLDAEVAIARAELLAWADFLIKRVGAARTKRTLCQMVAAL